MAALFAQGCQQYQPQPLDLDAHRAAFGARTTESDNVRTLATAFHAAAAQPAEFDLSDGVTCEEAETLALVFNADLRVARLRAGVTAAGAENAGLWEDPALGVDLAHIIDNVPNQWKAFGLLDLTVPVSGRLKFEKEFAGLRHAAELQRIAAGEWHTRALVRRAWADWAAADAQATATADFLRRSEYAVGLVERLQQSGDLPRTEARLFLIERAVTAGDLVSLQSRAREASLRLAGLMGLSPDAALSLRAGAIGPKAGAPHVPSPADDLYRRNPQIAVSAAEYLAAEKELELEISKQVGDLGVKPGFGNEDGLDQWLLGVSLPLPIFNGNRRAIAEAAARRDLARAEAETTLEHQLTELRSAEARLSGARARREALETGVAPLVDAQYADTRRLAELGEVDTLVLLETLTRQREIKLKLIDSLRDEALATADVLELLGPDSTSVRPAAPGEQGAKP